MSGNTHSTIWRQGLSSLILLLLSCASVSAGLEFEETTIEHHAKLLDEQSTAVFRFKNSGDTPIEILRVKSSCGCTVPELDKQTYAPGESGEIRALFTFGARQGRQMKRITVTTDDPARVTYQLDFITHIPTWGQIRPRMVRWAVGGDVLERIVTVSLPTTEGIVVKEPGNLENFSMELISEHAGQRVYRLTPKSIDAGVTEKVAFELTYTEGAESITRELSFYAIIR